MKKLILLFAFLLAASTAHSLTYTVTNCADSGTGSLRAALASAEGQTATIEFNIPSTEAGYTTEGGATFWRITLSSALSTSNNHIIDGSTQPTSEGNNPFGPEIVINLNTSYGMALGSNSTLKNLVVNNRSTDTAINLNVSSGSSIEGCYIQVDPSGESVVGTGTAVYLEFGSTNNTIGGSTPDKRNIFPNMVIASNSDYNRVLGNYIGVDRAGTGVLTGTFLNFSVGTNFNTVEGNVVGGLTGNGLSISGNSNEVRSNYIGTDSNETVNLSNGQHGIKIDSGAIDNVIGPNNVIAYNSTGPTFRMNVAVFVSGASTHYNTISQNSMYENEGGGIQLSSGANDSLASPTISNSATYNSAPLPSGETTVNGTATAGATVELFEAGPSTTAFPEGRTYEASAVANGSGDWTATLTGNFIGKSFTATSTDTLGNTSNFCGPVTLATTYVIEGTVTYPGTSAEITVIAKRDSFDGAELDSNSFSVEAGSVAYQLDVSAGNTVIGAYDIDAATAGYVGSYGWTGTYPVAAADVNTYLTASSEVLNITGALAGLDISVHEINGTTTTTTTTVPGSSTTTTTVTTTTISTTTTSTTTTTTTTAKPSVYSVGATLNFSYSSNASGAGVLHLYDLRGKEVASFSINNIAVGNNSFSFPQQAFDGSDLPQGAYRWNMVPNNPQIPPASGKLYIYRK